MKNYLIAERYAKGLSAAVSENADLEPALDALTRLGALYDTDHDFRSTLANPAIDVDRRAAVLKGVLEVEQPPRAVARLLEVMLRRGRIALLPDVARVFKMLVDERLNRVTAVVTTVAPLTGDQESRLQERLTAFSGKTVRIETTVDREILGGVVARIGGAVIDGSLRTRLEHLKQALLAEES